MRNEIGNRLVDRVALLHGGDRALSHIFVAESPNQVVNNTLSQGAGRRAHEGYLQAVKDTGGDGEARGDDALAGLAQSGEVDVIEMVKLEQLLSQPGEAFAVDAVFAPTGGADQTLNGAQRPRRSHGFLP